MRHPRRIEPTEHQIQAAVISWARALEHIEPRLRMLVGIPNQGSAGKGGYVRQKQMKAEGQARGFPDLFLFCPTPYDDHGLAIEMKSKTGQVKPEQWEWIEALNNRGYHAVVCRSFDDAIRTIWKYLGHDEDPPGS